MDLRSGASAERRRRVLREDAATGEAENAPRRKTRVRIDAAHYPESAQPHRQPRIADLLPTKWWSLALVGGIGCSLATGILTGFAYLRPLASALGEEAVRPFDLDQHGNLADWLASWTLLATALVAGIVYSLRRHRVDDYRGRYLAWPWVAGAIALGAVDAAVGFHQSIAGTIVALTGLAVLGQGAFWWILLEGALLLAVGAALFREYLRCRVSLAALALALLAYAGTAVAVVVRVDVASNAATLIAQEGFRLFGHLFLAISVLLYARHVLREVQGLHKSARRKRKTKTEDEESRVPAPHFKPKSRTAKAKTGDATSATTEPTKPAPSAPVAATSPSATSPKPAPPSPPKPEASRSTPSASAPAKPSAGETRTADNRSGDVRRTDPPAKPGGPLAGKLRPADTRVASTVASASTGDDDEDDDDDRPSRNKKKRR